jgi:hypothetical protein
MQIKEHQISLLDIIIFIKTSANNIIKSTLFCILAGGAYYFLVPKMYEASATIELATISGKLVEPPATFLEKIKVPLYFSPATLHTCGYESEFYNPAKFIDKINPTINKSAPLVSFVIRARSMQDAKACLNAVIGEASSNQDMVVKSWQEQKKQKLQQLSEKLKVSEETSIKFLMPYGTNVEKIPHFSERNLHRTNDPRSVVYVNDLRIQISILEHELHESQTHFVSLVGAVYAPLTPVNNMSLFELGLRCLVLGVVLGLSVTWVMRVAPEILRQIRVTDGGAS